MKVQTNEQARDFNTQDVFGNKVSLNEFLEQKIHLTFYRFSGCPNCNLRLHNIERLSDLYKENHVISIAVFESSPKNMKDQMTGYSFYSIMIPDVDGHLYKLYNLDRSKLSLLYYLFFKGGISELIEGKKLFKEKVESDGHTDRLEAEFLINESGKVVLAHYCERQGDFIEVQKIISFIKTGN